MEREHGHERRYLIDMDISKYADRRSDDTIDHGLLREMLGRRDEDVP
jgi:hypothetical protein